MKSKTVIWVACSIVVVVCATVLLKTKIPLSNHRPVTDSVASRERRMLESERPPVNVQPLANQSLPTISEPMQMVINSSAQYAQRIAAIQQLSADLSSEDIQAIYAFLLERSPADDTQLGQVLKNRIMDFLCALDSPPSQLGDLLAQIYYDRNQHEVIRDYAVQHFGAFYEQTMLANPNTAEVRRGDLDHVQAVLWDATGEVESSIAGTALLALTRLERDFPSHFDRKEIAKAAVKLAEHNGTGELARITGIQISARLGAKEALALAVEAAQRGETVPVQIAAINAVGILGGLEMEAFLSRFVESSHERLKASAQLAIAQIRKRAAK